MTNRCSLRPSNGIMIMIKTTQNFNNCEQWILKWFCRCYNSDYQKLSGRWGFYLRFCVSDTQTDTTFIDLQGNLLNLVRRIHEVLHSIEIIWSLFRCKLYSREFITVAININSFKRQIRCGGKKFYFTEVMWIRPRRGKLLLT